MFKVVLSMIITLVSFHLCFATIDVAIKTPECVVFASDSRTTTSGGLIASDTYEKIVKVTNFVMAQTAGTATPGNKNLKTTIQDFRWEYNLSESSFVYIDSVVNMFVEYCEHNKLLGTNYSGFLVVFAGPDSTGSIRYCEYLPSKKPPIYNDGYLIHWRGTKNVCQRILFGIETHMKDAINEHINQYISEEQKDSVLLGLNAVINKYEIIKRQILSWSLQDVIEYAHMLVNTTIIVDRMSLGKYRADQKSVSPRTGGHILVCVVTRDGVEWVNPPEYLERYKGNDP